MLVWQNNSVSSLYTILKLRYSANWIVIILNPIKKTEMTVQNDMQQNVCLSIDDVNCTIRE